MLDQTSAVGTRSVPRTRRHLVALGIHALHIRHVVTPLHVVVRIPVRVASGRTAKKQSGAGTDRGTRTRTPRGRTDNRSGRGTQHRSAYGVCSRCIRRYLLRPRPQRILCVLPARNIVGAEFIEGLRRSGECHDRRAGRYGHPVAVLFFDFDQLKALNDKHGHAAGDEALRDVAVTLKRVLRGGDHAFRIGGDEFAVLLPESTVEDAQAVAERIAEELRSLPSAEEWNLSLSCGISVHDGDDDPTTLLRSADDAMYEMKRKRDALGVLQGAEEEDLDAVA